MPKKFKPNPKNENCLNGFVCPECGETDQFSIACATTAVVTDEGVEDHGDMEWDEDSECTCSECGHGGKVSDFQVNPDAPPKPKLLRDALPPMLVEQIGYRMSKATSKRDNFLNWKTESAVGDSCLALVAKTQDFINSMGDNAIIDTSVIWNAVAHQCHIYAYA